MLYNQRKWCILFFIPLLSPNQATVQPCHKLTSRLKPGTQFLCNGFVDLLRLDDLPEKNIDELSFSKNDITSIDSASFNKNFSTITHLYLDNNVITTVGANAFKNLPNLEVIDLSYNKLEELTPEVFAANKNLITIDLTGNKITILDVNLIKKAENLKRVILSNNPLVCDKKTAETLHYLETKKIETFFLHTCKDLETEVTTAENKSLSDDDVKIVGAEDDSTIAKFIPFIVILFVMLAVAIALGFVIANLCLRISKTSDFPSTGRARTESENQLLCKDNQRFSKSSGLDENGYMIPRVPENRPQYMEVLQEPLISLHSEDDLRRSKIWNFTDIPVPHVPMPVMQSPDSTYQPNHVYEEIREPTFYAINLQEHLLQPYSCVKK